MKSEVGNESGCFDMAPYETRCASLPRSPAIIDVSLPPAKASGCIYKHEYLLTDAVQSQRYIPRRELFDSGSEKFIGELVIGADFGSSQALQMSDEAR